MKILIETADRLYELNLRLNDGDDFLDYYYTHELFPIIRSDESLTYIPKHAITAIHIKEDEK